MDKVVLNFKRSPGGKGDSQKSACFLNTDKGRTQSSIYLRNEEAEEMDVIGDDSVISVVIKAV